MRKCKCVDKFRPHRAKTLLKKVELVTHVRQDKPPVNSRYFVLPRAEQKLWKIVIVPQKVQPQEMGYLKELYTIFRGNSLKNEFQ